MRVCRIHCGMGQRRDQRTFNATLESDGSSTHPLHLTREEFGNGWSEIAKYRSVTEDILSTMVCIVEIVEQTLNARSLTPLGSDVNDLDALTPNNFFLGNRNVCLTYLPCTEEPGDHRKPF